MMTWPWTNMQKELQKRLKELDNPETLKTCMPVEDVFAMIKNRPPLKWYQKLWNKIHFTTYDSVWYVYRLFKPCHQKIRNTIPHLKPMADISRQSGNKYQNELETARNAFKPI